MSSIFAFLFGSPDCSWFILQHLDLSELLAFACANQLCFQAACNIRHLSVSAPINPFRRDFTQTFPMFTLQQIIQKALYLRTACFNDCPNQKFLLSLQFPPNLQTIRITRCKLSRNHFQQMLSRWKLCNTQLKHVETIDISHNPFWENILFTCDTYAGVLDELLTTLKSCCPCLRTVCVDIPVERKELKNLKLEECTIQQEYGIEFRWNEITDSKMYALNWNVLRIAMGLGELRWA